MCYRMPGVTVHSLGSPWTRTDRVAFGAFAAALLASLPLLVHPWFDATPDAAIYVATARSLADGEGYRYLGEPFRVRPPGFAALLAPLVAEEVSWRALNLVVALFAAVGAFLLALFLRPRLGAPLALVVGACIWLSPAYQSLGNQVMSDVPGTTLVLACLLGERWTARGKGPWRWALLGSLVGAAALVRSNAILLVPAIAAARLARAVQHREPPLRGAPVREVAALTAAAALLALPWALRNAALPDAPAEFTRIHSYAVAMWRAEPHDPGSRRLGPGEIVERVPRRALQTVSTLGSRLQARERGDLPLRPRVGAGHVLFALALVAGIGVQLWRRRESAEIFAALNLGVLLIYFGFSWRLLLPVYLIGLGAAVETLRDAVGRVASPRNAAIAAGSAVLLVALLDLPPRRGWEALAAEHERLRTLARAVEDNVARDERLASTQVEFGALLDRPVYNLRAPLRRDPAADGLGALLARHRIQHVLVPEGDPRAEAAASRLRRDHGEPARVPGARLWNVGEDAPHSGGASSSGR